MQGDELGARSDGTLRTTTRSSLVGISALALFVLGALVFRGVPGVVLCGVSTVVIVVNAVLAVRRASKTRGRQANLDVG
jgi:hypothetical protein